MKESKQLTSEQAIETFCCECMGHDGYRGGNVGTPLKEAISMVKECPDEQCPLWPYRNGND